MQPPGISRALTLAALSLLGTDVAAAWEVDTSYLSYTESDDRVSVSKALANLTRRDEQSTVVVNIVNDTMSGASPTGAIRSNDSAVTFTGASGAYAAQSGNDAKSRFDDERRQAGFNYERTYDNARALSVGAAVSRESDYESYGANIGAVRHSADRHKTWELGLAYTADTIYRSDTGGTPEPLSNIQSDRQYSEGARETLEALLGFTRVLNRRTLAQVNITVSQSRGYHSDPYKVISAADENDRIMANFYDSRPDNRLRSALFGKVVHQLRDSEDSIHASYRLYLDDWGVTSHTAALRYRHIISARQFLEPHLRLYRQSSADFYQRKLAVDAGSNPIIPDSGVASADYRLDDMMSATLGVNYGFSPTPDIRLRFRAEYLDQRFSTAEFSAMNAVILQTSVSYSFR